MKRTLLTSVFIFLLIFAFFIPHLNAEDQLGLSGSEPVISMDFKDASLQNILKAFSMQSGMNFISNEAVKDRKVTLYFDKVPLSQAMSKIFSANNLSYELDSKASIFVVKDWGKMEMETVTKVFYLKYATVSSSSLKEEMSQLRNEASSVIGGSGSSSSSSSDSSDSTDKGKWKVESEAGITSAVKKLLTKDIGSCIEDFRTNSLIITDTPMKIQVISQVIASLDVAVPQVMLEVEMLDVSKDTVDKVGFKFGDTPFSAAITGATASLGFPYSGWGKIFSTNDGTISINRTSYDMQLDFIRTRTDTKYLARPKLLTLNNETAEISITKDEVVGREDTTITTNGVTTTTSVFKRSTDLVLTKEGTGIFLRVTPQINLDKNEITMAIYPKTSVTTLSSLSLSTNKQADAEVRTTKSMVRVKDGETIVLGGLIHQDKSVEIKKLPILGDIPLLGLLFRHKDQTKDIERELIVFITPRIIRNKTDVKLAQIKDIQMPVREQAAAAGITRDYVINANMNQFEKKR